MTVINLTGKSAKCHYNGSLIVYKRDHLEMLQFSFWQPFWRRTLFTQTSSNVHLTLFYSHWCLLIESTMKVFLALHSVYTGETCRHLLDYYSCVALSRRSATIRSFLRCHFM